MKTRYDCYWEIALSQYIQYLTPSLVSVFARRIHLEQSHTPGSIVGSEGGDCCSAGRGSDAGVACSRPERLSSSYPAVREWKSPIIEIRPPITKKAVAPPSLPAPPIPNPNATRMVANTWYFTISSTKRAIARTACVVRRASSNSSLLGSFSFAKVVPLVGAILSGKSPDG